MAGGSQRDPARPGGTMAGRRWLTPVNVAIAGLTLLGLGLRLYLLSRPGYLLGVTQYDDGPYFGSALRLVHGAVPYRNFVIVQPPGITLLMTPAALLAQVTGTAWGMAVGRILTIAASSAGILLVGLLARHRGLLTVTLACGILAVFPGSVVAAHTVLLEPWLVLFCLAGALAVLDRDQLAASGRRLACGGLAFGFAGAVEVWAILPTVVVVLLLARRLRRAGLFIAGVAAGFLVPVLPFAALAPRRFYESFFAAQLFRVVPSPTPVEKRLRLMTGIGQVLHLGDTGVLVTTLVIVVFVPAAFGAAWLMSRRPPAALDWFAVGTCVLVVAAFLWYAQFFLHFPAFLAPFLGLAIGLAAERLATALRGGPAGQPRAAGWVQWTVAGVVTCGVLALAVPQAQQDRNDTPRVSPAALATVQRLVRPGACVLTDQVSFTIAADRFYSDVPGCSLMVDAIGTDYALGHGRDASSGAAAYPAVRAAWRSAFSHAQYVWLNERFNRRRIAWTPGLRDYFYRHFRRVYTDGKSDILYARTARG
jgi:Glycosyltransferase family 87